MTHLEPRDDQQESPPAPIDTADNDDMTPANYRAGAAASPPSPAAAEPIASLAFDSTQTLAALEQKDAELQQLQRTHDEYVKSSCEYEKELEGELERYEKRAQALEQGTRSGEAARIQLSARLGEVQAQLEAAKQCERALLLELEAMKWKVQRLEQANDELETAARIAQASVEDLEYKHEALLEQNVFLAQEKEEAARQLLASAVLAQVHPLTMASGSSLVNVLPLRRQQSTSARTSSSSSAGVRPQQCARGAAPRAKTRYPDVVESCIHITCQKCRAGASSSSSSKALQSHLASQARPPRRPSAAAAALEEGAKKRVAPSVFERLRLRMRALFNCPDEKLAAVGAASAPPKP
ncbi:hypothetical protein PybrP1_006298 [[Pythium] brassicae (nom. inval.)]|nr:hypothetical protein PybrP1_006298 [[Pythium] brassicae (nom. inval.)]